MEIIYLILEKGLLGLVLVGVGAYFARRLEKYKAGNAYYQALSTQKIKAYEEVAELISGHTAKVQSYMSAITTKELSEVDAAHKLEEEAVKFKKTYEESSSRLITCALYFTEEVEISIMNHLLEYSVAMHSFKGTPSEEIYGKLQKLLESTNHVFMQLRSEMHKNPFE